MKIITKKHTAKVVLQGGTKVLDITHPGEEVSGREEEVPHKQDDILKNANHVADENEKTFSILRMGKKPEDGEFDIFIKYLVQ